MSIGGKTVKRVGVEWVGEVNAYNPLHQTKALLRAECVSSPFMFLYFPRKDNARRGEVKEKNLKRQKAGKKKAI